jgi:hypothetical protein
MLTGQFYFKDAESSLLNPNTSPDVSALLTPVCNCHRQTGCEREQEFRLRPASFQPKVPAKMLKRVPLQDNWNLVEFLVDAVSDIEEINLDGDGLMLRLDHPWWVIPVSIGEI